MLNKGKMVTLIGISDLQITQQGSWGAGGEGWRSGQKFDRKLSKEKRSPGRI